MRIGFVGMLVGEDIKWKSKKTPVCFAPNGIPPILFENIGERVAASVC